MTIDPIAIPNNILNRIELSLEDDRVETDSSSNILLSSWKELPLSSFWFCLDSRIWATFTHFSIYFIIPGIISLNYPIAPFSKADFRRVYFIKTTFAYN